MCHSRDCWTGVGAAAPAAAAAWDRLPDDAVLGAQFSSSKCMSESWNKSTSSTDSVTVPFVVAAVPSTTGGATRSDDGFQDKSPRRCHTAYALRQASSFEVNGGEADVEMDRTMMGDTEWYEYEASSVGSSSVRSSVGSSSVVVDFMLPPPVGVKALCNHCCFLTKSPLRSKSSPSSSSMSSSREAWKARSQKSRWAL